MVLIRPIRHTLYMGQSTVNHQNIRSNQSGIRSFGISRRLRDIYRRSSLYLSRPLAWARAIPHRLLAVVDAMAARAFVRDTWTTAEFSNARLGLGEELGVGDLGEVNHAEIHPMRVANSSPSARATRSLSAASVRE